MAEFTEVADRVWVARYEWFDVNITAIGGDRGMVVLDTHGSTAAARGVIDDLRRLGRGEVIAVVNSHCHVDHTFGNAAFRAAFGAVPIHAHERAAEATVPRGLEAQSLAAREPDDRSREMVDTPLIAADQTFSSTAVLDLGDRQLELVHPGRGHTDGDLVIRLPDVDVVLAGDLIEESGPPAYGDDCWPMEWPLTLDIVLGLTTPTTVIVPGHGAVVDRDFLMTQRSGIGVVAETIRDLANRGVSVDDALASTTIDWPFDPSGLTQAIRRGFDQLPRSQKRLPLL